MTKNLYRLVYYSRNAIDMRAQSFRTEIDAILVASQRNNTEADVTGALLFNAGCFGQVLEGPQSAVETTFERIQCDSRHGEVSLLAFDPASARTFPNWSMGFVGDRTDHAERFDNVAGASGFDPSRMSGDRLLEALIRLALEEEQTTAA